MPFTALRSIELVEQALRSSLPWINGKLLLPRVNKEYTSVV